jgi:hypothetical protein
MVGLPIESVPLPLPKAEGDKANRCAVDLGKQRLVYLFSSIILRATIYELAS